MRWTRSSGDNSPAARTPRPTTSTDPPSAPSTPCPARCGTSPGRWWDGHSSTPGPTCSTAPCARAADPQALRGALAETLPDYLVPSAIVALDALPLTSHGKLDRKALPAPDLSAAAGAYVAPRTDAEATLAGIWAEVLGVERVGVEDNFVELGGDSILSIQVVSRARQAGLNLMPRDLFLHQTVASLAGNAGDAPQERSEQGPVTGAVPPTPIQHWFFETQAQHPERFDQSVRIEVAAGVDESALRAALAALAEHHDALRMRFELLEGSWHQDNAPVEA